MESHWTHSTMSYPRGTTLDNFHITIHKNTSLLSLGKSWLLTNLVYHVLEVNNRFHSTIKINSLQLKNTHISDILSKVCIFLGTPPCTDITASFWGMWPKTHISQNKHTLYFLPITVSFLTYLVIFTHDKTLLIFQLSLTYPFHLCD